MNPKPRRLNPCHRHPNLPTTTGLCAPCLHHRLSLLNPPSVSVSASPELRRRKSFSGNKSGGLSIDPRRRSCDVGNVGDLRNLSKGTCSLPEEQQHEDTNESGNINCDIRVCDMHEIDNVARVCDVPETDNATRVCHVDEFEERVLEDENEPGIDCEVRVHDIRDVDEFEEGKTIKEFIDIECQANTSKSCNRRDFKEIAGSFWVAASVLSKKLQKWRKKEDDRRYSSAIIDADGHKVRLGEMRLDRLRGRRLRDTHSEVGEYGFGRRSCDADPRASIDLGRASMDVDAFGRKSCDSDPRFSIDLGRASIDCGRISVDEGQCVLDAHRASWDGYLMGGSTLSHRATPMVSVIENAMATVYGFDNRILGECKMKLENQVERDSKLLCTEKEIDGWRLNSLEDDSSESFDTASKDFASVSSGSNDKVSKKCRQWTKLWNVWGLLNRRKDEKCSHEERPERGKQECPHPESTCNNEGSANGAARFDPNPKLLRSHSTSTSRGPSFSGMTSRTESKANVRRKNSSARFSPNHVENGLLRFYLTPSRSRRQTKSGKTKLKKSHSLARSVLRM